jgi:hypothetical protein
MAGTVKLPDPPELPCVGELVGRAETVACAEAVGYAERVAVAEGLETARCVAAAEVAGVEEGPDAGDEPAAVAKAAAEPPEADPDTAVGELDPVPAHAVRPVPPTTTAVITTGTRRILMLLPSRE